MEKHNSFADKIKEISVKSAKGFLELFKKYYFIIFCIIALLLPDRVLVNLPKDKMFLGADLAFVSNVFTWCWILIITLFCVFIPNKRCAKIIFAVVSVLFIALSFGQYVYYRIFEQFFWIKSIFLAGEGAQYIGDVLGLIDAKIIISTLISVACVVAALLKWKTPTLKWRYRIGTFLIPVILLVATHLFMQPELFNVSSYQWDLWRNPRLVYADFNSINNSFEINGFYQFTVRDAINAVVPKTKLSESDEKMVDDYFAKKGERAENEFTGLLEGKNVIVVMMESIDSWTIDEKYTPTLCKMMNEGINLTNFNTPMFGTGFTFGSEFAFNTGLFTPSSAANASKFSDHSYPYALARLFKQKGYSVNSYHFNDPKFYNRNIMHKSFGYERHNSFTQYGVSSTDAELDSYALTDTAFEEMTKGKPFFDFVITYSAHLPYEGDSKKLELAKKLRPDLIDESMNEKVNNALILAADTDKFFENLLSKLEKEGILEDTVIIAYTDHFAYGLYDDELVKELKGDNQYKVPAFIYLKGMEPKTIEKPVMTIDFAPTLVNLFNLSKDAQYIGNDFLDSDNTGFVFLENGDWIDKNMYYDHKNPPENSKHISDMCNKARELIKINDIIVLGDYYRNKK